MIKKRMMSASRDPNYNAKPEEIEFIKVLEKTEEEREELDDLIAMIQAKVDDGSIIEDAQPIDMDDLMDDLTDEQIEALQAISEQDTRNLQ